MPDCMLQPPTSKIIDINDHLSLLHINSKSISKKFESLETFCPLFSQLFFFSYWNIGNVASRKFPGRI